METSHIILFSLATAAMFATTFLRGFQNKSVAGGHKWMAFFGGGLMTALEGAVMLLIAHQMGSPVILIFTAIGSAFGWVAGMLIHDAMMRKRMKAAKQAKKTKRREQIEAMVNEQVEDRLRELGVI